MTKDGLSEVDLIEIQVMNMHVKRIYTNEKVIKYIGSSILVVTFTYNVHIFLQCNVYNKDIFKLLRTLLYSQLMKVITC